MSGATPPLPQYAFMAWCSVKHRDNFTLPFPYPRQLQSPYSKWNGFERQMYVEKRLSRLRILWFYLAIYILKYTTMASSNAPQNSGNPTGVTVTSNVNIFRLISGNGCALCRPSCAARIDFCVFVHKMHNMNVRWGCLMPVHTFHVSLST
jgi:hypothetical protein